MIIPIFGQRAVSSALAHASAHSVPGITLPPGDANLQGLSFHCLLGLARVVKKTWMLILLCVLACDNVILSSALLV